MTASRHGIQSMTGYGRAAKRTAAGHVTVELRSTNHRYLEIDQRLPSGLTALQGRVTELVRTFVRRGRIEALVFVQSDRLDQRRVVFDEPLLQRYHAALVELKARFGLKGGVTLDHLLALPQALSIAEERVPAERLWDPIRKTLGSALRQLVAARRREGAKLVADLRRQVVAIDGHVRAITRRLPVALKEQCVRLRGRLNELLGRDIQVPTAQLEAAAALVREADVHEELVRLASHLTHMRQTLHDGVFATASGRGPADGGIGKQLDFIAQELMREANTLGAKLNDPQAARHVVEIKGCIEKIREQGQNLE